MKRKEFIKEELENYYKQIITYVKVALAAILVYVEAIEHFDNPETDEAKKAFLNTMATLENCEKVISESNKVLIDRLHKYQKQSRCVNNNSTASGCHPEAQRVNARPPYKEKAK
jgi:hypothetical protein